MTIDTTRYPQWSTQTNVLNTRTNAADKAEKPLSEAEKTKLLNQAITLLRRGSTAQGLEILKQLGIEPDPELLQKNIVSFDYNDKHYSIRLPKTRSGNSVFVGGGATFQGGSTVFQPGKVTFNVGDAIRAEGIQIDSNIATVDRVVSSNTEETKFPDGSIQSKTTTTTYASGKTVVTKIEYDENGKEITNLTTTTDKDGNVKKVGFETVIRTGNKGWYSSTGDYGYTVNRTDYKEDGTKVVHTESYSEVTGKLHSEDIETTNPDGSKNLTRKLYDENEKLSQQQEWNHDSNGELLSFTNTWYDAEGNVRGKREIIDTLDENGTKTRTETSYDKNNNVTSEKVKQTFADDYASASAKTVTTKTEYMYDVKGNIIWKQKTQDVVFKNGSTSHIVTKYNQNNKVTSETEERRFPNGEIDMTIERNYEYDEAGKLKQKTTTSVDSYGKQSIDVSHHYVDDRGIVCCSDQEIKQFDKDGNLIEHTFI